MTRPSVLRSGALRMATLLAALFAVGAIVYVAVVHYTVALYARASVASAISGQMSLVRGESEPSEREALLRDLGSNRQFFYSLSSPDGRRLAGTLPAGADHVGWRTVAVPYSGTSDDPEDEAIDVLVLGARLADGTVVVIGRSLFASGELVEWLDETALWTAGGIVVLALGGGWLIASVFLRRLDRMNAAIGRIMDGAFAERLPTIGMGAEFDELAARLNAMLDRIIALMEGHRDLSTTIAHDLRTPLTRVRQRLESMRDGLTGDESGEAVDGVLVELDEVMSTFAALLRLGTIEAGRLRARFRPVDVAALLAGIRGAFAPVAEDQGKTLAASLPPGVMVMGDSELLAQLVTNLVENALLHTGPGTHIAITLRIEGSETIVEVADDGPGIPEAELANVLRRFHRLERSRATAGAGLGLALVEAIVDLHRGRIVLSNNAPGLRATVRLALHSVTLESSH